MRDNAGFLARFPALRRLGAVRRRARVPVVQQQAAGDCGAAALAMVLGYHGKHVALDEVREMLGVGRSGATAESLLRIGRVYGLRGRTVRAELEDLAALPAGTILHWEFRHFVVLERVDLDAITVVDPAAGRRTVPKERAGRAFTGIAILFEPSESFEPAKRERRRLHTLLGLVVEGREFFARIIMVTLLVQLLALAMPLLTGVLIDRVVPRQDYSLLLVLAVGFSILQVFTAAAGFARAHLMMYLRTQLEARFTMRFIDHLIELPYSYFQQRTSGDLMVRLGSTNAIREILTSTVFSTFLDGTIASLYLVLLVFFHGPITLVVLLLAAARLGLLAWMRWRQRQFLSQTLENRARLQTYQVEMLSGMETLKAMGLEHRAAENWSSVFVDGLNISIERGRVDAVFGVFLSVLGTLSTMVMMFYGTYLVLDGTWTLGSMMAFSAIAAGFLTPLNSLVSAALQLQMLEVHLERVNDVMNTRREQEGTPVVLAGPLEGAVTVDDVSFQYSGQDPIVLDHVSITVPAGARVALVGRTGSGKSTLARLLAGLYEPMSGRILFDGKDVKMLERRSVRNQLGIVTQETQLFGGTIRRNIALADPQMRLDRVIRAAKLACVHDEIVAMPMGYDTSLSDRGLSLSGGQRQRIAIARALACNPKVLILDEATSHLDTETEERLNRRLASLRCTTIVIAHRLSTVRTADLIVVLEQGRVVEHGSHDELVSTDGVYARLLAAGRDRGVPVPALDLAAPAVAGRPPAHPLQ
jgi:ATP-binding cassette, subfamily B, bacterial